MANELTKQTGNSQVTQWKAKSAETIELSKNIIKGETGLVAGMERSLTIEKTFSKPTLRSVFKGEAGSILFSVANVLVTRFVDSFGFSNPLNDQQIEMITVDALEAFNYESLEDMVLFFKMARSGKFGTTKRGLDSNLIFGEWLPMYLDQKAQLRERQYEQEKNQRNAKPDNKNAVAITYARIEEKKRLKKIQAHVEKITKNMDRQMLEDTILDWQKDPKKASYVELLKKKRKTIK